MSKVCDCGKGYVSAYDGKCGHCRTAKERSRHWWMIHKPDKQDIILPLPQESS